LLLTPLPEPLGGHLFALRLLSQLGQGILLSAPFRLVLRETVVSDAVTAGLWNAWELSIQQFKSTVKQYKTVKKSILI
jgi:ABC-type enterobactin transport system permease subunit